MLLLYYFMLFRTAATRWQFVVCARCKLAYSFVRLWFFIYCSSHKQEGVIAYGHQENVVCTLSRQWSKVTSTGQCGHYELKVTVFSGPSIQVQVNLCSQSTAIFFVLCYDFFFIAYEQSDMTRAFLFCYLKIICLKDAHLHLIVLYAMHAISAGYLHVIVVKMWLPFIVGV